MAPFRYEQFCPLARAAEILGERWTLLIARELACGPQRFSDLKRRLPGVSTSVLAGRLAGLEERGLVARKELPPPAPATLYHLTPEGEHLRPVLRELMRFGARHLAPPAAGDHLETEWVPLALEAFARRGTVPARSMAIELSDGDRQVWLHVAGRRDGTRVSHEEGPAELTLRTGPLVLLALVSGQLDPDAALASGAVSVEGDASLLHDLPGLFDLAEIVSQEP